jgi:formylglycine-generating enzyme required for sulfatase activity
MGDGVKMKFVRIEPGKFRMGSPPREVGRGDNEAQHEVEITRPFCLGVYEVTQAQYRQVMGMNPSYFSLKGDGWDKVFGLHTDDFPVERVNWEDAMDFCRIVSMLPGVRNRGWMVDLPMEAEWEYACRAGTETPYSFGKSLSSYQANFNGNNPYGDALKGPFLNRTAQVGSYPANASGLFDMEGNVLEWCQDSYDENHNDKDKKDASQRILRGGFWLSDAAQCRAAFRLSVDPLYRASGAGFRVVVRLSEG